MKIVVSGMWDFRISSLGAQALSEGLLLKMGDVYPDATIEAMEPAHLPFLRRLVMLVESRPALFHVWFDLVYHAYRILNRQRIRNIAKADLFVVSGDGLVADIFVTSTVMFACEIRYAIERSIPVVSLNQSINTSNGSLAHYCVSHWFMGAPLSVREIDSQHVLSRQFPAREIPVAIDAAFLCPPPTEEELRRFGSFLQRMKKRLGIDRYILVGVRANRPSGQAIDEDAWCAVLESAKERFPERVMLLASTCAEHDMPLARRLAQRVAGAVVAEELMDWTTYNYRFFQVLLQGAHACISDRYHQNVLAALNGTPFIPVAGNTSKTGGIRDLIAWPIPIQQLPTKDNLDGYREALDYLVGHYAELKNHLRELAPAAIKQHDRYREVLQGITDGKG